jgi:hypothetical protein
LSEVDYSKIDRSRYGTIRQPRDTPELEEDWYKLDPIQRPAQAPVNRTEVVPVPAEKADSVPVFKRKKDDPDYEKKRKAALRAKKAAEAALAASV